MKRFLYINPFPRYAKVDRVGSLVNTIYPKDTTLNLYRMFSMYEPQLTGKRRAKSLMDIEMKSPLFCGTPSYPRLFNVYNGNRKGKYVR